MSQPLYRRQHNQASSSGSTSNSTVYGLDERKDKAVEYLTNSYHIDARLEGKKRNIIRELKNSTTSKDILKALEKLWETPSIDEDGYIIDGFKGYLIIKGKTNNKIIKVSNYGSRKQNEQIGGQIHIKDVNSYINSQPNKSTAKLNLDLYFTEEQRRNCPAVTPTDNFNECNVYRYNKNLDESTKKEIAKLASIREVKEELGIDLSAHIQNINFVKVERERYIFELELDDSKYDAITKQLPLTDAPVSHEITSVYYQKYLKYKAKYLNLKKQINK